MALVRVTIQLPFRLRLLEGDYPTPEPGYPLHVRGYLQSIGGPPLTYRGNTSVWTRFDAAELPSPDEAQKLKAESASRLLRGTNRLLQWYRVSTGDSDINELTPAEASPFQFTFDDHPAIPWSDDSTLTFEISKPKMRRAVKLSELSERVRAELTRNAVPPLTDLLLLDAEQAARLGRYREAVLLCWSVIDGAFNRKYERLVEARLVGEWTSAKQFLTGVDFGMRNKMTAALFLVCGKSLFRELGPADWERLSNSYSKRNDIIHRGDMASDTEAEQAIRIAQRVIAVLQNIPDPA